MTPDAGVYLLAVLLAGVALLLAITAVIEAIQRHVDDDRPPAGKGF